MTAGDRIAKLERDVHVMQSAIMQLMRAVTTLDDAMRSLAESALRAEPTADCTPMVN